MGKIRWGKAAVVLLLGIYAGPAMAVVIDFETGPTGYLASSSLAPYGIASITWAGNGNAPVEVRTAAGPGVTVPSGTRAFVPLGYWWPTRGISSTTLTFAADVTSFSFKKVAFSAMYGVPGWRVDAYDAANGLVSSVDCNLAGAVDYDQYAIRTYTLSGSQPIDHVTFQVHFEGFGNLGSVPLDDFEFTFVPEPGTLILMGLAAVARRRRSPR